MTWMNLKLFYDFDSWEIIMTLWSFSERLYGLINQYPAWDAVNFWRYKIVSQKSGQSVSLSLLIGEKSEKKSKSHLIASLPTHAKFTFRSEKYRKKNFHLKRDKIAEKLEEKKYMGTRGSDSGLSKLCHTVVTFATKAPVISVTFLNAETLNFPR